MKKYIVVVSMDGVPEELTFKAGSLLQARKMMDEISPAIWQQAHSHREEPMQLGDYEGEEVRTEIARTIDKLVGARLDGEPILDLTKYYDGVLALPGLSVGDKRRICRLCWEKSAQLAKAAKH